MGDTVFFTHVLKYWSNAYTSVYIATVELNA